MSRGESNSVPLQAIKALGGGSEGIAPVFLILAVVRSEWSA